MEHPVFFLCGIYVNKSIQINDIFVSKEAHTIKRRYATNGIYPASIIVIKPHYSVYINFYNTWHGKDRYTVNVFKNDETLLGSRTNNFYTLSNLENSLHKHILSTYAKTLSKI